MVGPKASVDINVLAVSRMALMLAMALMFGSVLAQSVNAEKMPANGVSIAKRV